MLGAYFEIVSSSGPLIFSDASTDDVILRTAKPDNRFLMGNGSNVDATMSLIGNQVGIGTVDPTARIHIFHKEPGMGPLFLAQDATSFIITDTGNVGIGLTEPTSQLHVEGNQYLSGTLTIGGDLVVEGTNTIVNTENVRVEDNIITINANQSDTPLPSLVSGIEVERGDLSNYLFAFEEATNLFKIGTEDHLQAVATRLDTVQDRTVPIWDAVSSQYIYDSNVVIVPSGNVGIGTTDPLYKLQVEGSTYVNGELSVSGTSTFESNVTIDGPRFLVPRMDTATRTNALPIPTDGMVIYNTFTKSFEGYAADAWGSLGGVKDVDGDTFISAEDSPNADNNQLRFFTSNVERMTIQSNGTVDIVGDIRGESDLTVIGSIGVGTTVPQYRLDVGENTTQDEVIRVISQRFAGVVVEGDSANTPGEPGGSYVRFMLDGRTTGSVSVLQTVGQDGMGGSYTGTGTNAMLIGTYVNSPVQLGTNNNVRMTILATNGNVGIGSTVPRAKLDIDGTLVATGLTRITNTTNSTSKDTGALVVTGGVGIGGNLNVGGNTAVTGTSTLTGATTITSTLSVTGVTTLINTVNSTSTTTGALQVTGGVGIGGNLNVGGNTAVTGTYTLTGAATLQNTLDVSGITSITNSTVSTTTGTGALQVTGGVGIGGNLYVGGSAIRFNNTAQSTSSGTGVLVVTGGVGIGSNLNVGGNTAVTGTYTLTGAATLQNTLDVSGITSITNNTASSNTTTGALVVTGGVGIGGNLYVGGSAIRFNNTAQSTSSGTGVLVVTGGVGIGGNLNVGGNTAVTGTYTLTGAATLQNTLDVSGITKISNSTASTTTGTGALQVSGGVGIGGNLYVGGSAIRFTNTAQSTSSGTGVLVVTGGVGIGSNLNVGGNIVSSGSNAGTQFLGTTQGTALAPTFSWTANKNAGMYRPAMDDIAFATNSTERLRITTGGNVGIGTSNPRAKLHIENSGDGAEVLHLGTDRPWVFEQEDNDDVAKLRLRSTVDFKSFVIKNQANTHTIAEFATHNTEASNFVSFINDKVRIGGNGNVGIGTLSPQSRLHVEGSAQVQGNAFFASNVTIDGPRFMVPRMDTATRTSTLPSPADGMVIYNTSTLSFEGYAANAWGSLGGVKDVDGDTFISAEDSPGANNNQLRFFTSNLERMTIQPDGTINMGYELNLTTLTGNRVLISDASKNIVSSGITTTELDTLSGITSNVQQQLDTRVSFNQMNWFQGSPAPSIVFPTGGAFTTTDSRAIFRFAGNEVVYHISISGTINTQPSDVTDDVEVNIQFPIDTDTYPDGTILGDLWLTIHYNGVSTTYKAYARSKSSDENSIVLRYLSLSADRSLSILSPSSSITIQGSITYKSSQSTAVIDDQIEIPSAFRQDVQGRVVLNGDDVSPPRARLDIIESGNFPALLLEQQSINDIMRVVTSTQAVGFIINGNGNVGIGVTQPSAKLVVNGSSLISGEATFSSNMTINGPRFLVPRMDTTTRTNTLPSPVDGMVIYNTSTLSFEGYAANAWGSLGGVKDVDGDTFISAEDSPSADNNQLRFFTSNLERMTIQPDGRVDIDGDTKITSNLTVEGNVDIETITVNDVATFKAMLDVQGNVQVSGALLFGTGEASMTLSSSAITFDTSLNAPAFIGDGANLSNLNATTITSGTVDIERLPSASFVSPGIVQLTSATTINDDTLAVTASAASNLQIQVDSKVPFNQLDWYEGEMPQLLYPTGGGFTISTSVSRAIYRFAGNEVVYNITIQGTVASQPNDTSDNVELALEYPISTDAYPSETIIGDVWLTIQAADNGPITTYKAFVRTSTTASDRATLRFLSGNTEYTLASIQAGSTIILQGTLLYKSAMDSFITPLPYEAIFADSAQDGEGRVILNGGGNQPRARLEINEAGNAPAFLVEHTGSSVDVLRVLKAGTTAFVIDENGNVGIGTATTTQKLEVDGNIMASGTITQASDIRLKTNIQTIDNALDKVQRLRGVYFNSSTPSSQRHLGFIAQEVESIVPEAVIAPDDNPSSLKSVAYGNLVALLCEAIKDLTERVATLEKNVVS
jgi:hypothetical protein